MLEGSITLDRAKGMWVRGVFEELEQEDFFVASWYEMVKRKERAQITAVARQKQIEELVQM
jgi:hypothetical protein